MGFGSYDESEQQRQDVNTDADEDAAVNVHENDHDGQMTVESGASTDDLLGQLQEIKDSKKETEE
ncbi:death domain-associated protein [Halorubraceae archaeon YAN]|nr:death domain-associated protein [Halorubraceae archaeon YAN]